MANKVSELAAVLATFGGDAKDYRHTLAHLEDSTKRASIAASGSLAVNLDNIATATGIFVTADVTFSVTANGADTAQTYSAGGLHIQWDTSVTSLTVANTDSSNAGNFTIVFMGT